MLVKAKKISSDLLTTKYFGIDSAPTLGKKGAEMSLEDKPPVRINKCLQVLECNRNWRQLTPTDDINVRFCDECHRRVHNIRLKDLLKWQPRKNACIYIDFAGLAKLYPHILRKEYPFSSPTILGVAKFDQPSLGKD